MQVAAGLLKAMLYYDDTTVISSLHIPDLSTCLISAGEFIERLEDSALVFQHGEVTLTLKDDYSNYVAGVWYKILHGSETQIRFYLDEGDGDTFLFWGYMNSFSTNVEEKYIRNPGSSGVYVRVLSVKMSSLLKKVLDQTVESFITTLQGASPNYYLNSTHYLSINRLFSSFIKNALGTGNYHEDNSCIVNATNNFGYRYVYGEFLNTAWTSLASAYIPFDFNGNYNYYFDTNVAYKIWTERFSKCSELIKNLSLQFGVIPRYSYDIANSVHVINLNERGRNGSYVTFNSMEMIPASIQLAIESKPISTKTIRPVDETYFSAADTQKQSYDLEYGVDFLAGHINVDYSIGLEWWEQLRVIVSGTEYDIDKVRYYDFASGAYTETTSAAFSVYTMLEAQRKFYDGLVNDRPKKGFKRTYKGLKGSTDGGSTYKHTNIFAGCRTQIHDGIANRSLYANEVRKNVFKNTLTIGWIEE